VWRILKFCWMAARKWSEDCRKVVRGLTDNLEG
jgi:hypothetical protein